MYSGEILQSPITQIETMLEGDETNPIYSVPASKKIAGVEIKTPYIAYWHPSQTVTPISKDPTTQKLICSVVTLKDETFYMWMPEIVTPSLKSQSRPISESE